MNVETKEIEVQKVVTITEKERQIVLTLTKEEAKVICAAMGSIVPRETKTGKVTEQLYHKLYHLLPDTNCHDYFIGSLKAK